MCAEPAHARHDAHSAYGDVGDGAGGESAARYVTRTVPVLRALDAVRAEDAAGLAWALTAAEAVRPGVTAALASAFATEAAHLRQLARQAEATVARLRALERTGAADHRGAADTPAPTPNP